MSGGLAGVFVPALTPFTRALEADGPRFQAYCRWLLERGADGLAVFGTTSEATSLSFAERTSLLEALIEAGIPAGRLLPGTGLSALPETVALTRHAVSLGCLVAAYSETIERVGDGRLKIYLYHIPQMSGVPITLTAIERLLKKFPQTVVGIKDSSGNWENTKAILAQFPQLTTFPATEARLLEGMALGAAGCISASANMNVAMIRQLIDSIRARDAAAAAKQRTVAAIRQVMEKLPVIAAMKALYAQASGAADWATVRPPLTGLSPAATAAMMADLDAAGFKAASALQGLPG